jgi:hypothetical protein
MVVGQRPRATSPLPTRAYSVRVTGSSRPRRRLLPNAGRRASNWHHPLYHQLESTLEVVMAAPAREPLFEKLARLPPARVAEVEDFVDFLALRNADREPVHAAVAASVPAFAKVWDNPEDDVYDETWGPQTPCPTISATSSWSRSHSPTKLPPRSVPQLSSEDPLHTQGLRHCAWPPSTPLRVKVQLHRFEAESGRRFIHQIYGQTRSLRLGSAMHSPAA